MLVLPECAYPAYFVESAEAYRLAKILRPKQFVGTLGELARQGSLHVVSGLVDREDGRLYSAAALVDPAGRVVGTCRKSFLWHHDLDWLAPGERIETFETELGRIGILICADARAPEVAATLRVLGAELITMPACWINTAGEAGGFANPQPDFLIRARAQEFGLAFVCANKFGSDNELFGYCGRSLIVRADGSVAAEAPGEGETIIVAELKLQPSRPLQVPASMSGRLLSSQPPVRPVARRAAPIVVAAVGGRTVERALAGERAGAVPPGRALMAHLRNKKVRLVVAHVCRPDHAEGLDHICRELGAILVSGRPRDRSLDTAIAKVGWIDGQQSRSFAASRVLALDGAEVIAVVDAPDTPALLRARAMENRVFVVAVSRDLAAIIGPDGAVLDRAAGTDRAAVATLDLSAAADKTVAPNTDIWEQRRVEQYRLGRPSPPAADAP